MKSTVINKNVNAKVRMQKYNIKTQWSYLTWSIVICEHEERIYSITDSATQYQYKTFAFVHCQTY